MPSVGTVALLLSDLRLGLLPRGNVNKILCPFHFNPMRTTDLAHLILFHLTTLSC